MGFAIQFAQPFWSTLTSLQGTPVFQFSASFLSHKPWFHIRVIRFVVPEAFISGPLFSSWQIKNIIFFNCLVCKLNIFYIFNSWLTLSCTQNSKFNINILKPQFGLAIWDIFKLAFEKFVYISWHWHKIDSKKNWYKS